MTDLFITNAVRISNPTMYISIGSKRIEATITDIAMAMDEYLKKQEVEIYIFFVTFMKYRLIHMHILYKIKQY
jgi:hypothetical protein